MAAAMRVGATTSEMLQKFQETDVGCEHVAAIQVWARIMRVWSDDTCIYRALPHLRCRVKVPPRGLVGEVDQMRVHGVLDHEVSLRPLLVRRNGGVQAAHSCAICICRHGAGGWIQHCQHRSCMSEVCPQHSMFLLITQIGVRENVNTLA